METLRSISEAFTPSLIVACPKPSNFSGRVLIENESSQDIFREKSLVRVSHFFLNKTERWSETIPVLRSRGNAPSKIGLFVEKYYDMVQLEISQDGLKADVNPDDNALKYCWHIPEASGIGDTVRFRLVDARSLTSTDAGAVAPNMGDEVP